MGAVCVGGNCRYMYGGLEEGYNLLICVNICCPLSQVIVGSHQELCNGETGTQCIGSYFKCIHSTRASITACIGQFRVYGNPNLWLHRNSRDIISDANSNNRVFNLNFWWRGLKILQSLVGMTLDGGGALGKHSHRSQNCPLRQKCTHFWCFKHKIKLSDTFLSPKCCQNWC